MKQAHSYMGVSYETDNTGRIYHALLGGVPVTGTVSESRGEASMRFMLMLEGMQDFESKLPQVGDVIDYGGDKVGMIDSLNSFMYAPHVTMADIKEGEPETVSAMHIRESLGGDTTNFRGPSSAMSVDQTPRCSLSGGPFITIPSPELEWQGVAEIDFWAWREMPCADGGFKYKREVNIWKVVNAN